MNITVTASGMINPVGIGVDQVTAAVQAGLSQYKESAIIGQNNVPYTMALIPDECLPALDPAACTSNKGRYRRMLQLAIGAMGTLDNVWPEDKLPPLLLALPERMGGRPYPALEPFLKDLHDHGANFDLASSKVYPQGRAAGILAISEGVDRLIAGECEHVIVGGVDTHLDILLLSQLNQERRLLTSMTMQGFVPGEGAAFVLLSNASSVPAVTLSGVGVGEEPGHHYSEEVCLGVGLTTALNKATKTLPEPVKTVCCGLNGENVAIKEWGISAAKALSQGEFELMHPAESYGDLGAATLTTLLGLSAKGLITGSMKGPVSIWASSDTALRGAVTLLIN